MGNPIEKNEAIFTRLKRFVCADWPFFADLHFGSSSTDGAKDQNESNGSGLYIGLCCKDNGPVGGEVEISTNLEV